MAKPIGNYVRETKARLRGLSDVSATFRSVQAAMRQEIDEIAGQIAQGRPVIPEITFADIEGGNVSDAQRALIRRRGCVVVRGVYPQAEVQGWNTEIGEYIERNDYLTKARAKAGLDTYFADLDAGSPQIFGLYWSRPQIMARQGASMALTKRFLNRLWDVAGPMGDEFDPDNDFTYADRTRRRRPGDTTLGLSPHMDAGSYERWVDPAYQRIYGAVFEGHWQEYDPWKATYRTQTREYASPAVCSMFRTFQGWTALTRQGPGDGTLSLLPIANGIAYTLIRALQDDVPDDALCGAIAGRALGVNAEWHGDLLPGMVSIPEVGPGDTVWWHPDVVHSVADAHTGKEFANVIYVGATPRCAKNTVYLQRQAQAFLEGRSAPDFAPEDYEVDFQGRATLDDLTPLGRAQMGL